ncbi:9179_t:CDS:2, partial [Racocetra fulgida]
MASTEKVYIFIDNSNNWIQGKFAVGKLERLGLGSHINKRDSYYFDHLRIEYGCLIEKIQGKRILGDKPFIVGSRPPINDSMWKRFEEQGCEIKVFDRNVENREKKVDQALSRAAYKKIHFKEPAILALVAGDGDYHPMIEEALEYGMSRELKSDAFYMPLDDCYKYIAYGDGLCSVDEVLTLEVTGDSLINWTDKM